MRSAVVEVIGVCFRSMPVPERSTVTVAAVVLKL